MYTENFIVEHVAKSFYKSLLQEVDWLSVQARRKECFMAHEPTQYKYIEGVPDAPVYESVSYHITVQYIEGVINKAYGYNLNMCFLNYYENQKQALGWHSDNSPLINQKQPIAVVSLGEPRELWVRPIGYKGEIPDKYKFTLANGSLFIMPPGFQNEWQHKIPKGNREMRGRISLTYRAKK